MLKYIGQGFLPGVPARDLSDDEVEQCGGEEALIASGLYEIPRVIEIQVEARLEGKRDRTRREDKQLRPIVEDKGPDADPAETKDGE